jgi:ppGpp synthetase/RelA/SpoT-type nucleotidyltranferase
VSDISNQDLVVQSLQSLFEQTTVIDRRQQPSHGYRAVHVLVKYQDKVIEIQVRTSLQHLWAELSEKLSDVVDPAIKYGGGDEAIQTLLTKASGIVANDELGEIELVDILAQSSSLVNLPNEVKQRIAKLQKEQGSSRLQTFELLCDFMEIAEELKRRK